jgi:hypothetical protein
MTMKRWLANFGPQATDDELPEVVRKYKYKKLEVARLTREGGDESRPDAGLEFDEGSHHALCEARRRLSGLYWKTRSVTGYVPL